MLNSAINYIIKVNKWNHRSQL